MEAKGFNRRVSIFPRVFNFFLPYPFNLYRQPLERLKILEVEYCCADHYGYITGKEAREFIPKTIEMAKEQRACIEEACRSTKL